MPSRFQDTQTIAKMHNGFFAPECNSLPLFSFIKPEPPLGKIVCIFDFRMPQEEQMIMFVFLQTFEQVIAIRKILAGRMLRVFFFCSFYDQVICGFYLIDT